MYQVISGVFWKFGVHIAPFDEKIIWFRVRHCCMEEEGELL